MIYPESFSDLLTRGREAAQHGEWQEAVTVFQEARRINETAELLEQLGWASWWRNDPATSFEALEKAYQIHAEADNGRGAAGVAVWLARAHIELRGEYAVANGWLQRAHSHLEGLHESPEQGWVRLFEGHLALMGKKDIGTARSCARESITLGKQFHDRDIEMWGRALDGLALVISGDVAGGMQQLDEAGAIGISREAKDLNAIAATCCYLIHACERVQDHERARQWYARTREICERWHFSALVAICRSQYAFILMSKGEWTEAAGELADARKELVKYRPSLVSLCDLRTAELRRRQGKTEEAKQLFSQMESHPVSILGRGLIAIDQGDAQHAFELAQRYLRRVPASDPLERVPGLVLLLRAHIARKTSEEAGVTLGELLRIREAIPIDCIRGAVSGAAGLLSTCNDELDSARQQFEDAVDYFGRVGMPYAAAQARLQLAIVLQELDRFDRARAEAQSALEAFRKLGAGGDETQAAAFLQGVLKESPSEVQAALQKSGLSRREAEVLSLVAQGKSNEDIAQGLFLSIRTVERHISTIYQKIGVSGKAARGAAVSFAAKAGLLNPS